MSHHHHYIIITSLPLHHHNHQGIDSEEGHIQLITDVIHKILGIDMSALMGANIAMDVARQDFCEATIGRWGRLINSDNNNNNNDDDNDQQ